MKQLASILLLFSVLLFSACIRDEALSSECDITGVSQQWISSLPEGFFTATPVVRNRSVTFMVSDEADVTALAPLFEVTPGATIFTVEEDGTLLPLSPDRLMDFTMPKTYRVVSEDGAWQKDYTVSFERPRPIDLCDFEDFTYNDDGSYQRLLWRQTDGSLNANLWDSGNAGFAFTGQGSDATAYPTVFVSDEQSINGRYAQLRTLSTGVFGTFVGMPIAAGNLFVGEFQVKNAVTDPLHATRFGLSIVRDEPLSIEGDYQYEPGSVMTGAEQPTDVDACDIYAVLFEVTPGDFQPLFGDDVKTNERIVAIAQLPDGSKRDAWTHFELPFVYVSGKSFDETRRQRGGYALTIVMTSSTGGAYFRGAVGSTLKVDNLKINWKNS